MNQRLTRIAASALITAGTFAATLAGAAQSASPALADGWHGPADRHDRDVRHDRDWHDRDWHADRGPRFFDRAHGYWRDRFGYWNPRSGAYITFRL